MISTEKIAIITGASKGIGKAIAIGLAQLSYRTVLIGRDKKSLMDVAHEINKKFNAKPIFYPLDITDFNSVKSTIKQIVTNFGRIDVLVNNAGIYSDGSIEIDEDSFSKILETNLKAQYVFLKEIVPIMKLQKSGYIFNIASRSGKIGFAGSGAYSASKFGLVGLNESLYRELVPLGINVTALCPGWVNTKMAFEAGATMSGKEMIQPEDLFRTVKWLLSLSPGACVKELVIETPLSIT